MTRLPNVARFKCESCERTSQADSRMAAHLLPYKRKLPITDTGHCRKCGGGLWTISVVYSETDIDPVASAIGLGLDATIGVGFTRTITDSNVLSFAGVPAEQVAAINQSPKLRMTRVAHFVRATARQQLLDQGALQCGQCGGLFMPHARKPWTAEGCCSKACLAAVNPDSPHLARSQDAEAPDEDVIVVTCPERHEFRVSRSFAGLVRPCPVCGLKARVP